MSREYPWPWKDRLAHAPKTTSEKVAAQCDAIERDLDRLLASKDSGLEVREEILPPQEESALSAAETELGARLPGDLRAFLARGLRYPVGEMKPASGRSAGMAIRFLGAEALARRTVALRKVEGEVVEDPKGEQDLTSAVMLPAHGPPAYVKVCPACGRRYPAKLKVCPHEAAAVRRGIVVTSEELELLVTSRGDGVYNLSYRDPLLWVAPCWNGFLMLWRNAKCFSSGAFLRPKPSQEADVEWRRLVAAYGRPIPAETLPPDEIRSAIAEKRALLFEQVVDSSAFGVDGIVSVSFARSGDAPSRAHRVVIFPRPCTLTEENVALLHGNGWEALAHILH